MCCWSHKAGEASTVRVEVLKGEIQPLPCQGAEELRRMAMLVALWFPWECNVLVVIFNEHPPTYSEYELPACWSGILMASVNGSLTKKQPCFGVNT